MCVFIFVVLYNIIFYLLYLKKQLRDKLYVMLMLMRAEATGVNCDDEMVQLACAMESDECPAACREAKADEDKTNEDGEVVKSGDLAVTATPASERKAIIGAISDLDTLKFKTSEEVTISKIVLERYGYSKGADVEKVWLEDENGNEITTRKNVNSRDQVELSFKKDYKVVDGSVNATIVVELKNNVTTWGTIGFKVISATSTAENQELDKSWYTPYTYDMVGYDAVKVSIDAKGNDKDYNYEEGEMYEVAKFKLKAGTSPLLVNGVTLTNKYSGDKLDLKDFIDKVEVLANWEKVDGVNFNINKKTELNVSFDSVEVAAKENATFTVNVALAGFDQYGQGVKFVVNSESDVKIQEKKTWARVSVQKPADSEWAQHKFVGSKIKLSNTKLGNIEYAAWSSDVVVAEGTLTIAEAVELADNAFEVIALYDTGSDIIETMTLVIAGDEFDAERSSVTSGNKFTFEDVEITKGGKVQIKVDLDRDAPDGARITFSGDFDETAFKGATYPDGDDSAVSEDEISGAISFASRLTIQASKASLTNDWKTDQEFKDKEISKEVKVLEWKYTAKKGNITLSDFAVEATSGSLDLDTSSITFYLYIDGSKSSVADIRLKGTTISGSDSFANVKVKAGESVDVVVTAEVNAKWLLPTSGDTELSLGKFLVTLAGEDEDGNTAWEASRKTVDLSIVKAGSVVIADANTKNDKTILLGKGSDIELASFNIEPDGADTELETLEFTLSWLNNLTNATLGDKLDIEIDGTEVIEEDYCTVSGKKVTCADMAVKVDWKKSVVITLDDEDDAVDTIELTVNTLNKDTDVSKEFKKSFVNTLVKVSKQEFSRLDTTFTFSVEKKNSSDEAKNLYVYAKTSNGPCTELYSWSSTITNNSTKIFTNGSEPQEICKITYQEKSGKTVEIDKNIYEDYFKNIPTVWGDKSSMALMINDNAK